MLLALARVSVAALGLAFAAEASTVPDAAPLSVMLRQPGDVDVVEAALWAVDELRASSPAFATISLVSIREAASQVR